MQWKSLWTKSKGSIYQSPAWAEARRISGDTPRFLAIKESGQLKAGLLYFERTKNLPLIGKVKFLFSEGNPLSLTEEGYNEILKKFKKVSKNFFYGINYPLVLFPLNKKLEEERYKKVTNHTLILNLSTSEEELWKGLEKKSSRWGVKTAEKNKLGFVPASNEKEISDFYNIYKETVKQGRFSPEKIGFIKEITKSGIGNLFLIKSNNIILGGGLILLDKNNKYAILNLTASSAEGQKKQAMPYLYWNLILYAKSQNLKYFDFGGYDTRATEGDKLYNINKFKGRFGAEIKPQYIYSTGLKYSFLRGLLDKSAFFKDMYFRKK